MIGCTSIATGARLRLLSPGDAPGSVRLPDPATMSTVAALESLSPPPVMSNEQALAAMGPASATSPQQPPPPSSPSKARVGLFVLHPPGSKRTLRLVFFNSLEPDSLDIIKHNLNIGGGTIKQLLATDQRTSCFSTRGHLVCIIEHLQADPEKPGTLRNSDLVGILSSGNLIIIADKKHPAVVRIQQELQDRALSPQELSNSNYLFCRFLGAVIHSNETTIRKLDDDLRALDRRCETEPQDWSDQRFLNRAKLAVQDARTRVRGMKAVVVALGAKDNLFKAKSRKDPLDRYDATLETTLAQLDDMKYLAEAIERRWKDHHLDLVAQRSAWVATLLAALGPNALVTSLFSIDFPSWKFNELHVIAGEVIGAIAASLLVWWYHRSTQRERGDSGG